MTKLTDKQIETIDTVGGVGLMLSLIGTFTVIVLFYRLRKIVLTSFINHLGLCIVVSYFFAGLWSVVVAITNAKHSHLNDSLCSFQGWVLQFCYSAANTWTLVFATETFLQVIRGRSLRNKIKEIHIAVWAASLITSIIPLIAHRWVYYGASGTICWIVDSLHPALGRFVLFYIEVYIIMIVICVQYSKIGWFIYKTRAQAPEFYGKHRAGFFTLIKISLIPIVYVCLWVPGSVNRIQQAADPDHPIYSLQVTNVFCTTLIGLCNAIVYGFVLNYNRVVDFLGEQKLAKSSDERSTEMNENTSTTVEVITTIACKPVAMDDVIGTSTMSAAHC